MDFSFSQFWPFLQQNPETNDTSFESPKIEHLDLGKILGVATEKASLTLKLVWSLSQQKFSYFKTSLKQLLFELYYSFLPQMA